MFRLLGKHDLGGEGLLGRRTAPTSPSQALLPPPSCAEYGPPRPERQGSQLGWECEAGRPQNFSATSLSARWRQPLREGQSSRSSYSWVVNARRRVAWALGFTQAVKWAAFQGHRPSVPARGPCCFRIGNMLVLEVAFPPLFF